MVGVCRPVAGRLAGGRDESELPADDDDDAEVVWAPDCCNLCNSLVGTATEYD